MCLESVLLSLSPIVLIDFYIYLKSSEDTTEYKENVQLILIPLLHEMTSVSMVG